ncbi:HAMP domain-containing histidine kinase [Candidatus Saganbacteria bacterium]|uniref:histidine kinase n=1 Tax=Candidatus Saganbacteria bacterium TaxID=2575572 RepID=A0A9D6YVT1_UNCSA|nr:HAMP domain-containing histidine kinase [Candidatus Saganbacteria bacterium]
MNRSSESELLERLFWLVRLRWIAIAGVITVTAFTGRILRFDLPYSALYAAAAALALCNLFFYWMARLNRWTDKLANLQISLDLLFLALLIHFSGGIENPFIFYFIFHIIIAGILLSRFASFAQATFAVFLFLLLIALEYAGILPHYALKGFIPPALHHNLLYLSGISFVFISTLYIAAYMASSVSKRLKEANRALREKDRIKSEYVLRVSHDIKEHLSTIQSCIEPVTTGLVGPLNENQKDLLGRAMARTGKLLFFVRELLEITKLKLTQKLEMKEFSFSETAKAAAEEMGGRAKNKGLDFSFEIDPAVGRLKGVKVYIEEALSNILANAVKYTARGGIKLTVKDGNKRVQVKIEDTGIGIAPEDMPHIFEEFYRAENARGIEKMGTGLGLSIVKKIVEMHKGRIWGESEIGKGTRFFIELPKL